MCHCIQAKFLFVLQNNCVDWDCLYNLVFETQYNVFLKKKSPPNLTPNFTSRIMSTNTLSLLGYYSFSKWANLTKFWRFVLPSMPRVPTLRMKIGTTRLLNAFEFFPQSTCMSAHHFGRLKFRIMVMVSQNRYILSRSSNLPQFCSQYI